MTVRNRAKFEEYAETIARHVRLLDLREYMMDTPETPQSLLDAIAKLEHIVSADLMIDSSPAVLEVLPATLRELALHGTMGPPQVLQLGCLRFPNLETLVLHNVRVAESDRERFVAAITRLPHLRALALDNSDLPFDLLASSQEWDARLTHLTVPSSFRAPSLICMVRRFEDSLQTLKVRSPLKSQSWQRRQQSSEPAVTAPAGPSPEYRHLLAVEMLSGNDESACVLSELRSAPVRYLRVSTELADAPAGTAGVADQVAPTLELVKPFLGTLRRFGVSGEPRAGLPANAWLAKLEELSSICSSFAREHKVLYKW